MTEIIRNLDSISQKYNVILCDLWGCLHDGKKTFPKALNAIKKSKYQGNKIILLTNSPRTKKFVRKQISQIGILAFVDTAAAFFGPLFGVMISDYYLIKKGNLINKDIYSMESNGSYYFSAGWHIKGVYSLLLGFIFSASTIWNSDLMFLQSYSWMIGAFFSSITYYLLAKD